MNMTQWHSNTTTSQHPIYSVMISDTRSRSVDSSCHVLISCAFWFYIKAVSGTVGFGPYRPHPFVLHFPWSILMHSSKLKLLPLIIEIVAYFRCIPQNIALLNRSAFGCFFIRFRRIGIDAHHTRIGGNVLIGTSTAIGTRSIGSKRKTKMRHHDRTQVTLDCCWNSLLIRNRLWIEFLQRVNCLFLTFWWRWRGVFKAPMAKLLVIVMFR